jgi:alkanesulfonate monooxygenase SsuD/methylene tetrahydromethanopterin reductase-like flavin-dependent oxidoreductase (luciferase family)
MEPLWGDGERAVVANRMSAAVVGSVRTVKAGLDKLIADTGAREVIVIADTYEHADRLRSYELVAEVANKIRFAPARIMGTPKP